MASTGEAEQVDAVQGESLGARFETGPNALTLFTALGYFLIVIASRWTLISDPRTETGDFAADSLQAMSAWTQTDGVHSRWGYHHPGPLLLWLDNVTEELLSPLGVNPFGAHLIGIAALATVSIAVLVLAVVDESNRRWLAPVVFVLALVGIPGDVPVLPWAPTVGNWLFLLAVAAVVALVRGRQWGWPVAVVAALGLVHLHMLLIPFAAATFAVVAFVWWRGARPSRAAGWWSAAGAVVLAAPLVVAVAAGRSSWTGYLATQGDPAAGFNKSAAEALATVLEVLTPGVLAGRPMVAGVAVLFVVGLFVGCVVAARRAPAPVRVLAGGFLLGFAYIVAVSPTAYLTPESFGRVVPLLGCLTLACWLSPRLPAAGVGAGVWVLVVAVGATSLGGDTSSVRTFGGRGTGVAEQVLEEFAGYREMHPAAILVIAQAEDAPPWAFIAASSAAVAAARAGVPFCVAEDYWPYWVDAEYLCAGDVPSDVFRVELHSDTTYQLSY